MSVTRLILIASRYNTFHAECVLTMLQLIFAMAKFTDTRRKQMGHRQITIEDNLLWVHKIGHNMRFVIITL